MKIIVGIATSGRPAILIETLRELQAQTRQPDAVLVCPSAPADVDEAALTTIALPISVLRTAKGLTLQRNVILHQISNEKDSIIVFFDDDFFPHPYYIQAVETLLNKRPDIVVVTGNVVLDGATGPGVSPEKAREILFSVNPDSDDDSIDVCYNGYGCNMSMRLCSINERALRFDERLPLYGWLEDVDFSRQLAPLGLIVRSRQLSGVHLGVKGGRVSGKKFGYSQIVNPWYLYKKRTLSLDRAIIQTLRNISANLARCAIPEPWIDRRGRLLGNVLGAWDVFRGRARPENILMLV